MDHPNKSGGDGVEAGVMTVRTQCDDAVGLPPHSNASATPLFSRPHYLTVGLILSLSKDEAVAQKPSSHLTQDIPA
jgi:hypothetical protein